MLELEEVVLTSFRSTETVKFCRTSQVPFLIIKSCALVTNRADDRVLAFEEIHELRLAELKLTPEEYKQRFQTCREGAESWGQLIPKLDVLLGTTSTAGK